MLCCCHERFTFFSIISRPRMYPLPVTPLPNTCTRRTCTNTSFHTHEHVQDWTAIKQVEMSNTDAESFEASSVPIKIREMLSGEMTVERKSLKAIGHEWQQV